MVSLAQVYEGRPGHAGGCSRKGAGASSVAAVYGKSPVRRLLIGQPFGDYLLDCDLADAPAG